MAGTEIPRPSTIALTRSQVERSAPLRTNDAWLEKAWADPGTRVMLVEDGQALIRTSDGAGGDAAASDGAAELIFVSPERAPDGVRFLLGVDADDVVYFGVGATPVTPDDEAGVKRAGLREAGHLLGDRDAGLLTHAIGLANWHAVATHCSRCGAITEPIMSGHVRRCTIDGSEHFPRCDPAVIMLVADADDRCLLARNVNWPQRRVSVLAGFVEPGESAERAVAREVYEEVGITVNKVTYAASQPWPMPHSLMLGFRAEAAGTEIRVDAEEIAEAAWYSRDDLRAAIEIGDLLMPPSLSISRWLIETWFGGPLPRAPKPR
ncbi:MAG TPA: NAD(+) diphosphatase [Streptosporangiaceae bacterium]|nr:NAD(+) diphosphatase [Streptosporangiaceae bacterium]